jgi:hypothetical protein
MARLRKAQRPARGRVESADTLPTHEGPRPEPHDVDAYDQWLRTRDARMAREVGGATDPRLQVMTR